MAEQTSPRWLSTGDPLTSPVDAKYERAVCDACYNFIKVSSTSHMDDLQNSAILMSPRRVDAAWGGHVVALSFTFGKRAITVDTGCDYLQYPQHSTRPLRQTLTSLGETF